MNFPDGLFPDSWAYGAFVLLTFVWLWCIRLAPWQRLRQEGQINAWLGAIVVLVLMWSMKAGVKPGLALHLLGVTTLTLMFGRALAILGFSLVLAAVTLNSTLAGMPTSDAIGWQSYALNLLATDLPDVKVILEETHVFMGYEIFYIQKDDEPVGNLCNTAHLVVASVPKKFGGFYRSLLNGNDTRHCIDQHTEDYLS